jgi:hypothetical protein
MFTNMRTYTPKLNCSKKCFKQTTTYGRSG